MFKFLRALILLVLPWIMVSCYDCGPMGEPFVDISLSPKNQLVRISALGAKTDSLFRLDTLSSFGYHGQLPISLLQDSTTFLFYFPNHVDTLTLYYQRVFDESKTCGYYNDIKAPVRGPSYRSTFPGVHVEYYPYQGSTAPGRYFPRGIHINIQNQ
ncbi:hypothetical protein [Telluribacter humicola]|uniref:hypothetical protein n=1 Tax=Telluribacter humicola TaxID=1720261 RepID=UPI001A9599AA|nr:hypothetical protein [Telluribacter humicola]